MDAKMVIIMKSRYLSSYLRELSLARMKMAFLTGPRQVGKTTLAKTLLQKQGSGTYYNWDDIEFRRKWVKHPRSIVETSFQEMGRSRGAPLLVLDELHKAKGWKGTLKGIYDHEGSRAHFLVTGSARLNVYKKGSDSLMGRYLSFRLHPLSVGELLNGDPRGPDETLEKVFSADSSRRADALAAWKDLSAYGGFPEPFFSQSEKVARLWRRNRLEKIVREDLRDLSRLPELSQVEMLVALLPEKAAGSLSVQSLREDLEVAHDTVKRWLTYLSELYYFFEIKPYTRSIPRTLKKEGKLYLWDWSEIQDEGSRFENRVASHLLKACHYWTDTGEGNFELQYLRDKQKREIDFVIIRDKRPWLAIEAKKSDTSWSSNFDAFQKHLGNIPCIQVVDTPAVRIHKRDLPYRNLVCSAASVFKYFP